MLIVDKPLHTQAQSHEYKTQKLDAHPNCSNGWRAAVCRHRRRGAISAQASVTTLGLWRLGEDDAGAVLGNTGNDPTTAAVGFDLDLGGDPTYSSNTPGAGSAFSMAFDGTGDVYSRGEPVTTATDSFGIEAWVSFATLDTGGKIRIIAYNGDLNLNGWGLVQIDSFFYITIGGQASFAPTITLEVDRWYHVAFVLDAGSAVHYLDGVATLHGAITPSTPTDPFLIGGNIAGSGYF